MPKKGRQTRRMTPGFTGPFKGEPQQGTLFDKRALDYSSPTNLLETEKRVGPRGYSVERSRQFQDIIPPHGGTGRDQVGVSVKFREAQPDEKNKRGYSELHNTVPAVSPGEHSFGPSGAGAGIQHPRRTMQRGRSKMIDTLARSTVDPKDLHGLGGISVNPENGSTLGEYYGQGAYNHIRLYAGQSTGDDYATPERVKQPQQRGGTQHDPEITLLHEIGHHVSNMTGTGHSSYDSPRRKAEEEGFADNYAMTHWRADPRHTSWGGEFDPRQHTYYGRGNVPGGTQNLSAHLDTLGRENRAPKERSYVSPGQEAEDRPMLGHGTGVFDKAIPEKIQQGFSTSWMIPGQAAKSGTEAEKAWYGRRRQDTNRSLFHSADRPNIPPRWQTRRHSLGRQF